MPATQAPQLPHRVPREAPAEASTGCHVRIVVPAPLEAGRMLGLSVQDLVVHAVDDPRAASYGWLAGDRVLQLNGHPLSTDAELASTLGEALRSHRSTGSALIFDVWRPSIRDVAGTQEVYAGFGQGQASPAADVLRPDSTVPASSWEPYEPIPGLPRQVGANPLQFPQPPAEMPAGCHARIVVPAPLESGRVLGLSLQDLVVQSVDDPRAASYDWTPGDRILRLNSLQVSTDAEFHSALGEALRSHRIDGSALVFDVWRPSIRDPGYRQGQASPAADVPRQAPAPPAEEKPVGQPRRRACCCGGQRLDEPEIVVDQDDVVQQLDT